MASGLRRPSLRRSPSFRTRNNVTKCGVSSSILPEPHGERVRVPQRPRLHRLSREHSPHPSAPIVPASLEPQPVLTFHGPQGGGLLSDVSLPLSTPQTRSALVHAFKRILSGTTAQVSVSLLSSSRPKLPERLVLTYCFNVLHFHSLANSLQLEFSPTRRRNRHLHVILSVKELE